MHGLILTRRSCLIAATLVFTATIGLAGCASTSDMTKLQDEIARVRLEAQEAKQIASRASQQATDANRKADQAMANSTEAQNTAANAQKAATDANLRVDRMFQKTMNK